MWDVVCILAWIGTPIAALAAEFRHIAGENYAGVGCISAPLWALGTVLGLFWSGWFTIAIFVLLAAFALLRRSEARIAEQASEDARRRADLEREWRREERAEIEEDYRLGLIDSEEYDHQMRDAGFRPDEK